MAIELRRVFENKLSLRAYYRIISTKPLAKNPVES